MLTNLLTRPGDGPGEAKALSSRRACERRYRPRRGGATGATGVPSDTPRRLFLPSRHKQGARTGRIPRQPL